MSKFEAISNKTQEETVFGDCFLDLGFVFVSNFGIRILSVIRTISNQTKKEILCGDCFLDLSFEFVSDFGIRISDFACYGHSALRRHNILFHMRELGSWRSDYLG